MTPNINLFLCIFLVLAVKHSVTVSSNDTPAENHYIRVRRQDGYVYNRPSISFDLPAPSASISSSTTSSTQAPNVDRILTQHMFYAYPAPAGGSTINVGSTAGTTTTTALPGSTAAPTSKDTSGYGYKSSTVTSAGYNYNTPGAAQSDAGSVVTNIASKTTVTESQSGANSGFSQSGSGYGYNVPTPTLSPSLQKSTDKTSTSAPRYLPPTGGVSNSAGNTIVNIGGISANLGIEKSTSVSTTQLNADTKDTPSDTYLPPLVPGIISSTATSIGSSGVSVPSTSYLPPKSSPSPFVTQLTQGPTSSPPAAVTPAANYLPPSNTVTNSGTVSTPASGYLPPGF